ncbi:MAG: rRNA maturation RNase YbeY [Bacteroidota bacterium]|nr:rRNA maturation RNase YbeY [Bacteroidota bacterium]
MAIVRFSYADVKLVSIKRKKLLRQFTSEIFELEGKELQEINYIFCSDDYLLEINRSFLKHDFFTDIVTFDLSENSATIGEVYISVDRVKDNSIIHGVSFNSELCRVVFHGALHLIGYKDKKKSEITTMRQKEERYLRIFASI